MQRLGAYISDLRVRRVAESVCVAASAVSLLPGRRRGLAALSAAGGLFLLFSETMLARRLKRINREAVALGEGDLDRRLRPLVGDELGDLVTTLNTTADGLGRAFHRISEKEETLQAVLDALSEGVLATDLEGGVIFANPVARGMLDIDEHTAYAPGPWEDFSLQEAISRCAHGGECGEARVRGEGTFLRIYLHHIPAFDDHRGGVLVVISDLSEGREVELQQQKFLSDAAHELQTPLSNITLALDLLEEAEEAEKERFIGHIHSSAEHMRRLSDSLLRVARVGWGPREPRTETVSLATVARSIAEIMEPLAKGSGVSIRVAGEGKKVIADPDLLEQALLAVVSNALKHSGREVTLNLAGNTISVEDTGPGMSQSEIEHVFERFYRGERGGFGLGLSIVRELVEGMSGEISVSSPRQGGAAFHIELPEARQ